MRVEIDQSGRVEDLATGTAVAFSNGKYGAIFISAGVKREVVQILKTKPLYALRFASLFFATLVFILIKEAKIDSFLIDAEYPRDDIYVEEVIKKLFKRKRVVHPNILFGRIGKRSSAHALAWKVHRTKGYGKKVAKVSLKEVLSLL